MSDSVSFSSLILQQWQQVRANKWLWSMLSWLPITVFLLIWWIFSAGLTRELNIGLVDLDHSQLSRSLSRHYDASPTLRVLDYPSEEAARSALRSGQVYGMVIFPPGLEKNTLLSKSPTVAAYFNGQFMVVGKQINSALRQSHGTFMAKIEVVRSLSQGNTQTSQAIASALPIRNQISALYNGNSNYAQFLVSAALPAFWQVLVIVVMILAFASELRDHSFKQWLAHRPLRKILTKLIFFGTLLWLHGLLLCTLMFHVFGWPMRGSWSILLLGMLLCVIATQAIALLLMMVFENTEEALSIASALTAPSFAFMGVTFPISDMSWFAQFWRSLIPITHYIEIQLSQANYGASLLQTSSYIINLLIFSICFVSAGWLIAVRRDKVQEACQ